VQKILRDGFYWPSIFSDVYKEVSSVMNDNFFMGRENCSLFP
jgi:hypothetical protein